MTEYKQAIDGLTGENVYIRVNKNSPKVSKNAKRKAKRYGKTRILSAHANSNKDSSGLKVEWSRLYHQHRISQNPRRYINSTRVLTSIQKYAIVYK